MIKLNKFKPRILLVRQGCHHCRKWHGIVERINFKLPPEKRIKIVDVILNQAYDIDIEPLLNKVPWQGTPTLILTGLTSNGIELDPQVISIEGMSSRQYAMSYLLELLKDDFLIYEGGNEDGIG